MTELDQIWSDMLGQAALKAIESGRRDVADYLRLKAANDAIRAAGVGWLIDVVIEIATEETSTHSSIKIERTEPHNFAHKNSNMVGTLVNIRHGVRCLSIEAGWTRTPRDGIMTDQALAFARLTHFGLPRMKAEYRLVRGEILPRWLGKRDAVIDSLEIRRHFDVLLRQ
jgi:hypothetical protein